ncbi:MAG: site-specific DNA-methyltransferase [Solirubrobacterales bacterium]|nr:site-specific DNA-methyltransferase [Solirubrobacterales bacterium]
MAQQPQPPGRQRGRVVTASSKKAIELPTPGGRGRGWKVIAGDSLAQLPRIGDQTVDAVVTDPPYGIDFQGADWDGRVIRNAAQHASGERLSAGEAFQQWTGLWAGECLRILKPGGHLLAFGAPRTVHRLAAGVEDAGFELRDTLMWLYGTGMPKSRRLPGGQGTQLKPAYEPIILARRPPDGAVGRNIARHGTGALNVDACRVNDRYPAHLVLTHTPLCDEDSCHPSCPVPLIDDSAHARGTRAAQRMSRLFYCPKASRAERNAGCDHLPARPLDLFPNAHPTNRQPASAANDHPTVKPLDLMRWLVRLATPPGGMVLDPFCGSGSTGAAAVLEQRRFAGIERDPNYQRIARARIAHWATNEAGERDGHP